MLIGVYTSIDESDPAYKKCNNGDYSERNFMISLTTKLTLGCMVPMKTIFLNFFLMNPGHDLETNIQTAKCYCNRGGKGKANAAWSEICLMCGPESGFLLTHDGWQQYSLR